jgi:mannonate dehydratase
MALWDIKGKMAGMPVYDLLGGKSRAAAATYVHANGKSPEEVCDQARRYQDEGYSYIRVQMGGYGGVALDSAGRSRISGAEDYGGVALDRSVYIRDTLRLLEYVREHLGDEVELLHDVHERLHPIQAVGLAKELEAFKLFFLEDLLAPEDIEWFEHARNATAIPLAMGELFNHPKEWQPLIEGRLIDFMRMHLSQMGGITPARNAAISGQLHGVRTAWHGPGDTSPVGHAANLHLDLWATNFGIQEWCRFGDPVYELFPGTPLVREGYMYPNDEPGLGIDIDEKLAAKYPCSEEVIKWTQTRLPDGTLVRP